MADNVARPVVVVTGASGLLGRAVYAALVNTGKFTVVGTSFTRGGSDGRLKKLDVTDRAALRGFFAEWRPAAVIHCAAERRPDVAQKNKEAAHILNVTAAGWTAAECRALGAWFCYISTDYVFDGTQPPYEVEAQPTPINYYGKPIRPGTPLTRRGDLAGQSKWEGEQACMSNNADATIFRVPLLYGNVEFDDESAVNCLLPIVKNPTKIVVMDDYQIRYPTNCDDAAKAIVQLVSKSVFEKDKAVKGIYHFCGKEKMTKYEMCQVIGSVLGVGIAHLQPLREIPKEALTSRPYNAHLSNRRIEEEAGIKIDCVPFKSWWEMYLAVDKK
ncbi:Methionine adenosyltransferase 2 subunit beta [Entophlyctis luteolus]|nr:Methionine adenosyltransferase 2 subunit beta [Entophlyctis luteolus]KAJ3391362.1 Methionine adenosyltransferase 2 subunit beta [Entophlyctis sp. JEL0112]